MKPNLRQILALLLAAACLLGLILPVLATEADETTETTVPVREPGQCGENAYWTYTGGTLTVTGSGPMDDFPEGAPWSDDRLLIRKAVIGDGITYIGAHAFENYDQLADVQLGKDVYEIGASAFRSCDALKEITFPRSFKIFGEDSFRSCALMYRMHFQGGMPKFKLNCLWDTTAKLIYPASNPWPKEHIIQLEEAFQTRIEFLCSDGTDPYVTEQDLHEATAPTEETEATTVATTEATQPQTVPETTAATEATVQTTVQTVPATTEEIQTSATQAATQAPTQASAAPETAPAETSREESGSGIGFAIIMACLSLIAIGALIFGRRRPSGKYGR